MYTWAERFTYLPCGLSDMVSAIPNPVIWRCKMPTKQNEVLTNPLDIMANGSLTQASKKPTALVPQGDAFVLTSTCVSLTRQIVKTLSDAERDAETIESVKSGQVANLRDLMLINSVDEDKEIVFYPQYKAISALFINEWIKVRKLPDTEKGAETAGRAFNRYFALTDLDIPLSNEADAVRKREAKEKRDAEMKAIPNLDKAIQDAVAVMDFDTAKKLKAEATRRKTAEAKEKGKAIADELDPIKKSILDELKLCMDKATLVKVVELLRGK